jgi:hypothetical protein
VPVLALALALMTASGLMPELVMGSIWVVPKELMIRWSWALFRISIHHLSVYLPIRSSPQSR